MSRSKSVFGLASDSLSTAFTGFTKVWWQFGVVAISAVVLMFISLLLGLLLFFLVFGLNGSFENFIVNLQNGGAIDSVVLLGMLLFLLPVLVLFFMWAINAQISNLILVKSAQNGQDANPFRVFFVESWHYFWRYNLVMLIVFWRFLWRVLLVTIAFFAPFFLFGWYFQATGSSMPELPDWGVWLFLILYALVLLGVIFYVLTKYSFSYVFLVEGNLSGKTALEKSEKSVLSHFWSVTCVFVLFVLSLTFLSMVIDPLTTLRDLGVMQFSAWALFASSFVSVILQIFILTPITSYFWFDFSKKVAKKCKIKI